MSAIRVLHVGLGPIGAAALRQAAAIPGLKVVGAVDLDPAKAGRDAAEVAGVRHSLGVAISPDLERALRIAKPDLVVHCTSSSLVRVMPELETILKARAAIVSTTEELSYPLHSQPREAALVDRWAKRARVAVLGTGVNPGFAMDVLPIALTAVCERVSAVRVDRLQDARIRRRPFQEKIGAGLTVAEFWTRVRSRQVRHVGLTESIGMIADACGWTLDRIAERIKPKIAGDPIASRFFRVKRGHVAGIVQDGVGYVDGRALIRLHMEAYLGAPQTCDTVKVTGVPSLHVRVVNGIHGDLATPALVINSIPKVLDASPGLHTMRDLPLPSIFAGASTSRPGTPGARHAGRGRSR